MYSSLRPPVGSPVHIARTAMLDTIVFRHYDAATERCKGERLPVQLRLLLSDFASAVLCGGEDARRDFRQEWTTGWETAADDSDTSFNGDYGIESSAIP